VNDLDAESSHRGGQGFKSPQLHPIFPGQSAYARSVSLLPLFRCPILGARWEPILPQLSQPCPWRTFTTGFQGRACDAPGRPGLARLLGESAGVASRRREAARALSRGGMGGRGTRRWWAAAWPAALARERTARAAAATRSVPAPAAASTRRHAPPVTRACTSRAAVLPAPGDRVAAQARCQDIP
jgi:hypothetical protein